MIAEHPRALLVSMAARQLGFRLGATISSAVS
jgi:hypothetical protein